MNTRNALSMFALTARALVVATLFVGPLAGFAAAQDGAARGPSGAGLVLYISLLRG